MQPVSLSQPVFVTALKPPKWTYQKTELPCQKNVDNNDNHLITTKGDPVQQFWVGWNKNWIPPNKKGEKYNFSIKEKSGILHELTAQGIPSSGGMEHDPTIVTL